MNKINKLPDEIPITTHNFLIDLQGSVTKKRFVGDFTCKIPTIKDQAMIARHNAMLNGEFPVYLDGGILKIHKMISYLRFTLIDIPKFWRESDLGYDLRDYNVIEAVYDEVMSFEEKWLSTIWDPKDEKEQEKPEDGPKEEPESKA